MRRHRYRLLRPETHVVVGPFGVDVEGPRERELRSPELRVTESLTIPVEGRPGYRRDPLSGTVWYSAEWL